MDVSSLVLYYDPVFVYMDDGTWICRCCTSACGALFDHLSWVIIVSEVVMLPVFLYWFYVVVCGKTTLPRWMAAGNVLVFYCILYVIKSILPDTAFRLGFTNGLMSESMIFFFILIWIVGSKTAEK